ncbi:MAG TPA: hypothetical protein VGV67_06555, partial [Solirubrobacteraceae bacterium]|nr:hypothetical protein [Solirubrobacteraceae bacterium]
QLARVQADEEELHARLVEHASDFEKLAALDARLREVQLLVDGLNATRAHDDDRLATFRSELSTALDAAVRASFSGFQSSLDERLTVQEQRLTRIRESIGSRVDDVVAELDRRLIEVGASVAEVDATIQGRLPALLDARLSELSAVIDERMPALFEARLGDLVAAVDERLPEMLEQRFAAIHAVIDEQLPALLEARLNEVTAALDERLPETLAGSFADVRAALDERLGEVTAALEETIPAGIDARLAEVSAALDERLPALLDARLAEVAEALDERLPTLLDARLAEVAEALDERLPALLDTRLAEIAEALDERLPTSLEEHRAEMNRAIATSLEAARERFARATDELRGVASELVLLPGQLDARTAATVERASTAARAEAQTATVDLRLAISRLQDVSTRVGHLEQSLVAYLEARDLRMEEERTRVLADVLENFGGGMTRRERRRMSSRIGDAVDRSRVEPAPPLLSAPPPAAPPTPAPSPAPLPPVPPAATVIPRREADPGVPPVDALATMFEDDDVVVVPPPRRAAAAPAPRPAPPPRAAAKRQAAPPPPAAAKRPAAPRKAATTTSRRTAKPVVEEPAPVAANVCPVCGFVAKSAGGLAAHSRKHA